MDKDTIFVRTNKGDDEVANKTAYLEGDVLRALLLVDGVSTLDQLGDRAPANLRGILWEILPELESSGFIRAVMAQSISSKPAEEISFDTINLDFSAMPKSSAAAFDDSALRADIEAGRIRAEQDAEQIRIELDIANSIAQAEAALRTESATKPLEADRQHHVAAPMDAKQTEAEQQNTRSTQDLATAIAQLEEKIRADLKVEEPLTYKPYEAPNLIERSQPNSVLAQPVSKKKSAIEPQDDDLSYFRVNIEADRDTSKTPNTSAEPAPTEDLLLQSAKQAASSRDSTDADFLLLQLADDAAKLDKTIVNETFTPVARTFENTGQFVAYLNSGKAVLFFELLGYDQQSVNRQIELKKQINQLLSDCLAAQNCGDRIILDTDDGAVIAFLQAVEDALKLARQLRKTIVASHYHDYFGIKVRIGIHFGDVDIVQESGITNLQGDGVVDAFAVMNLAGAEQIVISSAYYDCLVRINPGYSEIFKYCGRQKDKYEKEYSVYELQESVHEEVQPVDVHQYVSELTDESFKVVIPGGEPIDSGAPPIVTENFNVPEGDAEHIVLLSDIDHFINKKKSQRAAQEEKAREEALLMDGEDPEEARRRYEEELLAMSDTPSLKHLPSADDVSKFAENEAKQWEQAKEAAKPAAPKKIELIATPEELKAAAPQRARRKSIPWKKVVLGGLFVSLAGLVAFPFVMPTQEYANQAAQFLTERVQQPVQVGGLEWRLLPSPNIELSNISVGTGKTMEISKARLKFNLPAFFSSVKAVNVVELEGVNVQGAALIQVGSWVQQAANSAKYPISKMKISQANVSMVGGSMSKIGGEIDFDPTGKFTLAKLATEDNKYLMDVSPSADSKAQLWLRVHDAALPWLPRWAFNDLSVKAEVFDTGLTITSIDGFVLGGKVLGDARLSWDSGWRAQGNLSANSITMGELNKTLEGDLDGKAQFRMQSESLATLTSTAIMNGSFAVRKGTLHGVDVVESMRLHSGVNIPGGRTHFDALSGNFAVGSDGNAYAFRQLKMDANALSGSGSLDINKKQLAGQMSMYLQVRGSGTSLSLRVSGDVGHPMLRVNK